MAEPHAAVLDLQRHRLLKELGVGKCAPLIRRLVQALDRQLELGRRVEPQQRGPLLDRVEARVLVGADDLIELVERVGDPLPPRPLEVGGDPFLDLADPPFGRAGRALELGGELPNDLIMGVESEQLGRPVQSFFHLIARSSGHRRIPIGIKCAIKWHAGRRAWKGGRRAQVPTHQGIMVGHLAGCNPTSGRSGRQVASFVGTRGGVGRPGNSRKINGFLAQSVRIAGENVIDCGR